METGQHWGSNPDAAMPLYFAYGSNMIEKDMLRRCPKARMIAAGYLPCHRWFVTRDGHASIRRDRRAQVHGLLWDIALSDMRALDRYEDIEGGYYLKTSLPIFSSLGPRRALVYLSSSQESGEAHPGYVEAVVAAARNGHLPARFIRDLEAWLPRTRESALKRPSVVSVSGRS